MRSAIGSVDLGGTKTACAIATPDGEVLAEGQVPTQSHEGPGAVLARIAGLLSELRSQASASLAAIGFGAPGLVDVSAGITRFLPNLPTQWRDVTVAATLQKAMGCPVYLLNDARMATLGEFTYGRGRNVGTMAFFTIGTGIGGGLVIDGKLRLGPLGAAGELGHQTIQADGPLCGCGNRGCLETLASGPALTAEGVRLLRSGLAQCCTR